MSVRIARLGISDFDSIGAIITIHQSELSRSVLLDLGEDFLRDYYRLAISRGEYSFVAYDGGRIVGYLLGFKNPDIFMREVMLGLGWRYWYRWSVFLGKHWRGILLGSLHRSDVLPELQFFAVEVASQRQGIGKQLLQAFHDLLSADGVETYLVHARQDDKNACGFYERNKYQLRGTKSMWGEIFCEYMYSL